MRWSRVRTQRLTESRKVATLVTRYSSPSIFELSYRTTSQPSLSNVVPGLGRLPMIHSSSRTMKHTLGGDADGGMRNCSFTNNSKIIIKIDGTGCGNSIDLIQVLMAVGEFLPLQVLLRVRNLLSQPCVLPTLPELPTLAPFLFFRTSNHITNHFLIHLIELVIF